MDDTEIMKASLSDNEAFGLIVDKHGDAVLSYLTRRVGPVVAEDLTAETFLRAFAARERYEAVHETVLPWLYRIATNLLRSHVRSEQRRIDVLARMAGRAVLQTGEERVDESLTAAATLQGLAAVFSALSDDARDVLVLVAIERLSYEETATALELPVGTVRSRLSRARMELRQSLTGLIHVAPHDPDSREPERGMYRG